MVFGIFISSKQSASNLLSFSASSFFFNVKGFHSFLSLLFHLVIYALKVCLNKLNNYKPEGTKAISRM